MGSRDCCYFIRFTDTLFQQFYSPYSVHPQIETKEYSKMRLFLNFYLKLSASVTLFPSQLGGTTQPTVGDLGGGGLGGIAGLGDIFGFNTAPVYIPPQEVWLTAAKGKGLEIMGTMSHKNNQVLMDLTLSNKAMQAMTGFAAQFNKNRFVTYTQFLSESFTCLII